VVSSHNIDCDCGHFDYRFCTIQLLVGLAKVQDTEKFFDQRLDYNYRGVRVNDASHTVTKFAASRLGVFLPGF